MTTDRYLKRQCGAICLLALLTVLMLLPAGANADVKADLEVAVSLSRDTIGSDEVATMEIVVSGNEQNLPGPQLPALPMFDVYSQGRSTNLRVINNRVSSSVTYRYQLIPKKAGTFVISDIAVVHRNKRHVGNRVTLTVLDQGIAESPSLQEGSRDATGNSRDYFLLAEVDKKEPYVNEQVTLTLKFCTAVQYYNRPELTAPSTTGFWNELLGNKPAYTQVIDGRTYQVLEIKYALFPTQTGELTIGRAMINTTIASRNRTRRRSVFSDLFQTGQEVTVRSRPITVNVKPLPEEGRPDDFTGTIGQFSISMDADKTEAEVNEPVTVKVRIRGQGNIKSVAEPTIEETDDFRVYRASSNENTTKLDDRLGGTKEFEEVFIPKRPGQLEIPALQLAYFNPRTGAYERKKTRPIVLNVKPGELYVGGGEVPYQPSGVSIGSAASDIRFIKQDIGSVKPVGALLLTNPAYLILNGIPVLAFVALFVLRVRRQQQSRDIALVRSRGASKEAKKRLAAARGLATPDKSTKFYAELQNAVTRFIADRANISPHGLTTERMVEILQDRDASGELVSDLQAFMRRCDFARYAPASVSVDGIQRDLTAAGEIITSLERV